MSKKVLVTGGTRGIGREIAVSFKTKGDDVIVLYGNDVNGALALETEHQIKSIKCDVSDFESCKNVISKVEDYLGTGVQVLINNAGITKDKMLHKQEFVNWSDVIAVNLTSVFNMSRVVIEKMREAKYGRIINISSVNANGALGQTNYSASKAGIEGFTKSLALETAKLGITVNAIAPGYVNTKMVRDIPEETLKSIISKVPMNRLAEPHEIAATALFLASDSASFITGAVIPVNGGLHM